MQMSNVYIRVFIIRLTRWKWNPTWTIICKLEIFLVSLNGKDGSLKKVENEKWGKKIHCYDQLRLYKHVIKELAPNMWLRMGLDNTKMADNVSLIVKVLSGSKKGKRKIYIIKANASFLNYFTKS